MGVFGWVLLMVLKACWRVVFWAEIRRFSVGRSAQGRFPRAAVSPISWPGPSYASELCLRLPSEWEANGTISEHNRPSVVTADRGARAREMLFETGRQRCH